MGACQGGPAPASGQVKFVYFPLHARGMPGHLALEVGNIDYVAQVIQLEEWFSKEKYSGAYPFGYLGMLELPDGTKINETTAIAMTVGKMAGLNGDTDRDFGISMMLSCKAAEVFTEFTQVQPTVVTVKDWNADKAKKLAEFGPKLEEHLNNFEKLCSPDGKFTSSGNTIGELHLFSTLYHLQAVKYKFPDSKYAKLTKFYANVSAIPGVARVVKGETKFGKLHDYVVPVPK